MYDTTVFTLNEACNPVEDALEIIWNLIEADMVRFAD